MQGISISPTVISASATALNVQPQGINISPDLIVVGPYDKTFAGQVSASANFESLCAPPKYIQCTLNSVYHYTCFYTNLQGACNTCFAQACCRQAVA